MIRIFTLRAEDQTYGLTGDTVDLVIEINDAQVGLTMTIDDKTYRLLDQAVFDLTQVVAQVKLPELP